MNTQFAALLVLCFFVVSFSSASTNGTFVGNETETKIYISSEFDVTADLSATQYWAETWMNTSEIDFGYVEKGSSYRKSYQIAARGNVNIKVVPTLTNQDDDIFSNLYFSRTTTGWKKVESENFGLIFNLTQNKGLWSVIGASDTLKNLSTTEKGTQNIQLDLTTFDAVVPFDQEYRNTVKFVIVPDWDSVE